MIVESSSVAALPQKLSVEGGAKLYEGITLILSRWSGLQLAIDNDFGDRDSPRHLADIIISFFTQSIEPLYIDDLETRIFVFLDKCMATEMEDDSIEEIAELLMIMHEECLEGDYHHVQSLRDNPIPREVRHIRQVGDNEDDDDSDEKDESSKYPSGIANSNEEMMVDDDPRPNVQAEDGWKFQRRRGRKN